MVALPRLTHTDPFNDLNGWAILDTSAGVPSAAGGALLLPVTADTHVMSMMQTVAAAQDAAIEHEFPVGSRRYFQIRLAADPDNWVSLGTYKTDVDTRICADGTVSPAHIQVGAFSVSTHRWLRLQVEAPTTVAAWTSPDGVDWTLHSRITHNLDLSVARVQIAWGNDREAASAADGPVYQLAYTIGLSSQEPTISNGVRQVPLSECLLSNGTNWHTPTLVKDATVTPEAYGAIGDGVTDDTAALRAMIADVQNGNTILLSNIYRHTDHLRFYNRHRITLTGGGVLAHDSDVLKTCALIFERCSEVRVRGVGSTSTAITRRVAYEDMRIVAYQCFDVTMDRVAIRGSAATGIMMSGTDKYLVSGCLVVDSLADSYHSTGGSSGGRITRCRSYGSGDDGFATVSYGGAGAELVTEVLIEYCSVFRQKWGRAYSLIGGQDVRLVNCSAVGSAGSGLMVATEPSYNTGSVLNVSVDGMDLADCCQQSAADPAQRPSPGKERSTIAPIHIYSGMPPDVEINGVTIRNVSITNTHPETQNAEVRVETGGNGGHLFKSVLLSGIDIFLHPDRTLPEAVSVESTVAPDQVTVENVTTNPLRSTGTTQ